MTNFLLKGDYKHMSVYSMYAAVRIHAHVKEKIKVKNVSSSGLYGSD